MSDTAAIRSAHARTDGRSTRWDAHRATRREQIITAAIAAIAEQGPSVGMDQIAAAAGTSKPVVYRYFLDKTELYRAISTRLVTQVLSRLRAVAEGGPSARELVHESIESYVKLIEAGPQLFRFVVANPLIDTDSGRPRAFGAVVADLLASQLEARLRECGLDPAQAHPWGEGIVGFITATSMWWLDHRDSMAGQQFTAYLAALLWGGAAGIYQSAGRAADPRPQSGVLRPLGRG